MTKYFVFTDLHGSAESMERLSALILAEKPDVVVSLGDVNYSGARNDPPYTYAPRSVCSMLKELRVPVIYIKGNCDSEVDEAVLGAEFTERRVVKIASKSVMFTHGHRINPAAPPLIGYADDVIYGHTHVNSVLVSDGVKYINVASCSIPKSGCPKSYAVIEDNIVTIKDLDGNVVLKTEL